MKNLRFAFAVVIIAALVLAACAPAPAPATEAVSEPAPATEDGAAVYEAISRWDGRCDTTSTGCSAYLVFENALVRAIFDEGIRTRAVLEPLPGGSPFSLM